MQHPDEGTIHAWLDGALSDAESADIEAHVQTCETCAAAVAEARGLIAAASRILSHLDDVPAGVRPATMLRLQTPWYRRVPVQAAAGLLIVALGTTLVVRDHAAKPVVARAVPTSATPGSCGHPPDGSPPYGRACAPSRDANVRPSPIATRPMAGVHDSVVAKRSAPSIPAAREGYVERERVANSAADAVVAPATAGAVIATPAPVPAPTPLRMQRKAPMVLSSVVASGCQITAHVTPSGAHAVLVSGDSTAVASKACVREGTPLAPVAATAFSKKVTANRPAPVLNVLHWVDATTQQVYILRGYTSIEELEALKKKLQR